MLFRIMLESLALTTRTVLPFGCADAEKSQT